MRIFEMLLAGHSINEILAWVNTTGIRPGRRFQKRAAGSQSTICNAHSHAHWHWSRIGRILRNRVYLGERKWGEKTFACVPLIDQETWDRTQALLAQRATGLKPGRGYRPGQGLLGGLLHCAKCGGTFYHRKHRTHGQIRHYYICTTNRLYHSRCDAKLIPIPQLDQDVWNLIESYLQEPEELIRKVIAADQTHSSNVQELAEQETEAIQSFEKIETEVASIWAEQQAHSWPVSWVAPKLNQLNQRRETVQNHLAEIRRQRATILVDQNQTQAVTAALARIRAKLQQGLTDEDKYHIIRLVVAGGTIRTIGTGFQKTAQITIQLKWGEVASPELPKH